MSFLLYDYSRKKGVYPVEVSSLHPGDHIMVLTPVQVGGQKLAQFSHHAIFVGDKFIGGVLTPSFVHSNPGDNVVLRPLERLTSRYDLFRVDHDDAPDKNAIVQRCLNALHTNTYPKFSVLSANCEHFANYCVYGKSFSKQIRRLKIAAAVLGAGVGAAALVHYKKQKLKNKRQMSRSVSRRRRQSRMRSRASHT